MKITLFTSNKNRHNYLINLLSEVSDELYVIQECGTIFPGIVAGHYQVSPIMKKYFENAFKIFERLFSHLTIKCNLFCLKVVKCSSVSQQLELQTST